MSCPAGTNGPGGCYSVALKETCNKGLVCSSSSADAACVGNLLTVSQTLKPGQCIYSPNYQYRLCFQADGRLIGYDSSDTWFYANYPYDFINYSPGSCMIESTGNFACFNKNNVPIF